jgi:iron complex outermembrane receptor protein
MTNRQFESTFDNSVTGVFALADFHPASWNDLKVSLNFQKDIARTQDDAGLPFVDYKQGTFSAALEDEIALSKKWRLVGGFSLDVIDKFIGDSTSRLNPMLGFKFSPNEALDLHASASMKSRMPNMRALYSTSSGNPDLLGETGTNAELGAAWTRGVFVSASLFTYRFKNMIDTYTLPDGTRRYMNVGKAHITGGEFQLQKSIGPVDATFNYTYLDHRNDVDNRPLDALSPHNLNFDLTVRPLTEFRLSVYGLYGSKSSWWDSKANKVLDIPAYFNLDAVLAYDWKRIQLFVKATNLLNDYFYAEPIFPWRGRFLEFGAKVSVF